MHGLYSLSPGTGFGVPYRRAGVDRPGGAEELPEHLADLSELDRATKRHMDLQDRLADALRERGINPLSPSVGEPQFDLAFEHAGKGFLVEVKSGDPVSTQQMRLGAGQLCEYRHQLRASTGTELQAVLLIESTPPEPWEELAGALGVRILQNDRLEDSLPRLLRLPLH